LSLSKLNLNLKGNLNYESQNWNIGLIYGKSGTGKTTIAKQLFSDDYIKSFKYKSKSILDDMPDEYETKEIAKIFNSVGFASVPNWLKSYDILSTGEQMRVNLARAILLDKKIIVFDEFTSVVDRVVARIGSLAMQKAIRILNKKFIAVSCHSDIIDWLLPDWTFCTDTMKFQWRELRRPEVKIKIYNSNREFWGVFKNYHYLNTNLHKASQCFVGVLENEVIVFIAILHFPHPRCRNFKRVHRLVVLPDYQGVGIGNAFLNEIAKIYLKQGFRFIITTTLPTLKLKNKWKLTREGKIKTPSSRTRMRNFDKSSSYNKFTRSFEYLNKS